ncbi:MAG TPA: 4a-hydroxytetrahydrobiopterin dehydratase [Bacillales bacterium]|nr:4a-hydroxytetrahydrobiopterin dehydratase [Bacillales bacterium]
MERLSENEIAQQLSRLQGWKRLDEKFIQKRYRFKTFPDGVTFVNRIAALSEEVQHHPFIAIDYKVVTLKLSSWHAGGLTDLDFELAGKYDAFYNE